MSTPDDETGPSLSFWNQGAAPLIRMATNGLLFWFVGSVIGDGTVVAVFTIVGIGAGFVHGFVLGQGGTYDWGTPGGWVMFLADNTWSLPNTAIGSLFSLLNIWNRVETTPAGTGQVFYRTPWLGRFDTTIGNVTVGTRVPRHEAVHGLQARIFGPTFYPLVILHYVINVFVPVWLVYHDHARLPIKGPADYFLRGVYRHHWIEEWAYGVEGTRT